MIISGNYTLSIAPPDYESDVPLDLDWSQRHEVVAGAIADSASWMVVDANGSITTDLTIVSFSIDPTNKITQARITVNPNAIVGPNVYALACKASFSDGTGLVRGISLTVQ